MAKTVETMNGHVDPDEFKADPRRFRLVREEDETGVSGTGVVGVGSEYPDGQAVFMWTNDRNPDGPDTNENSVYVYPGGMEDVREVHGHSGKTRVEWVDPSRAVREGDAVECPDCGGEVPLDEWTVYRTGGGSCPLCGRDGLPERVRERVEAGDGTRTIDDAEEF